VANDLVEQLTNGEVRLTIDAEKYKWKRPKAKEYRHIKHEFTRIGREAQERLKDIKEDDVDTLAEIEDQLADDLEGLLREVNDSLFVGQNGKQPDSIKALPDDLPIWLSTTDFMGSVFKHWQEVPYQAPGN